MKRILTILYFTLWCINIYSQSTWSKSFEVLPSNEQAWDIIIKDNKIYLQIVGKCADGQSCSSLVEMDLNGNVLNSYVIEDVNYTFQRSNCLIEENNRIINLGTSYALDTVRHGTVSEFNLKTYEFKHKKVSNKKGFFVPSSISKWTTTNNFLVIGQFQTFPGQPQDAWCGVSLLDSSLNIIKDTILNKNFYNLRAGDFYQDSDTSFIYFVTGCIKGDCKQGVKRVYSYRINKNLEIIDSSYIGKSILNSSGISFYIEPSEDNNLISTWRDSIEVVSNVYEPYISKIDKKGGVIWKTNFFVDEKESYEKIVYSLLSLKNGDFLVVGFNSLPLIYTGWAARIDKDGNILWERSYFRPIPEYIQNFSSYQYLFDAVEGEDGSIYMCGVMSDTIPGIQPPQENHDNWVMKVGPDGCLVPGCSEELINVPTFEALNTINDFIIITPNISSYKVNVLWNNIPLVPNQLIVTDIQGKMIKSIQTTNKSGSESIDIGDLSVGMYFITLKGNGWQGVPKKFIKQH